MNLHQKYNIICKTIEKCIYEGKNTFILYPFGSNGMYVQNILEKRYKIKNIICVDNGLCKFCSNIYNSNQLKTITIDKTSIVLVTVEEPNIYNIILDTVKKELREDQYIILFNNSLENKNYKLKKTVVGKYSGGDGLELLCGPFVKSIGAFCLFAYGTSVVPNHPLKYISTHPFLYGTNRDGESEFEEVVSYNIFSNEQWFFPGIEPKGSVYAKRISIGNDVWLGRNVIITNYANIGNGVVAGAGAVITKDVPDYAIVVGCPARIIRYRYSDNEIMELNEIAWWDWDDDKIIRCYDDFFLPVNEFIALHKKDK